MKDNPRLRTVWTRCVRKQANEQGSMGSAPTCGAVLWTSLDPRTCTNAWHLHITGLLLVTVPMPSVEDLTS